MKLEQPESVGIRGPRESAAASTMPGQPSWKEALELWLRWNECYEHVSAQAFAAGGDPRRLEELMDEMDQVRQQALDISRRLVADSPRAFLGS
jgi:hypothetical protein